MKAKFYIVPLALFTCLAVTALKPAGNKQHVLPKSLEKLKAVVYIPQGTCNGQSIPAFYMFKEEVTVLLFNEFLYHVAKKGDKALLASVKPDSTLWKNIDANGSDILVSMYGKMHNYPVVNITKQAAEAYCTWLTDLWNTQQSEYILEFRLPTVAEWEHAAGGGNSSGPYPWGGPYCRNSKGLYLAQHKAFGLNYGPAKTGSFEANGYGLYNMSGNAAEMVSDAGITKGGSWNSNAHEITIFASEKYAQSPMVGFRPVMTFIKR